MPTYEYICHNEDCGHEFEIFQSMKDNSLTDCPQCSSPTLKRKIGIGAGIIFKGSGFYETDYKRKKETATKTPPKSDSKDTSKPSPSSSKATEKPA